MTKVKICGITNLEDARAAVALGADMLGFNFYSRSPRYLSPGSARQITAQLPKSVKSVGVFVNETVDAISDVVRRANLDAIQLHGDEDVDLVNELRKSIASGIEIVKAFRTSPGFDAGHIGEWMVDGVMLDAFVKGEAGGTGVTCDWSVAKRASQTGAKIYLAGGLSQANVHAAVIDVQPYAVDACSLLESRPGYKDHERMRRFIVEAKRND